MGRRFDRKGKQKKKASREGDASSRLSYLWGAAHIISDQAPNVARFYVSSIKQVGRRINLGLDAKSIKRFSCKRCHALVLPGLQGSTARIAPRREKHVVITCGRCKALRRFLARPSHLANENALPTNSDDMPSSAVKHGEKSEMS